MKDAELKCEQNAKEVLSALPPSLGFCCRRIGEWCYELLGDKCVVQLTFDRYEPTTCVVLLSHPKAGSRNSEGMSLWVLRHLRGIQNSKDSSVKPFFSIGKMLTEHFGDLLFGGFPERNAYERIEKSIFDRSFDAEALPDGHPTRTRFENYDLQWLNDLDNVQ